jgi:hypothetical protein
LQIPRIRLKRITPSATHARPPGRQNANLALAAELAAFKMRTMHACQDLCRYFLSATLAAAFWQALEQPASAQLLLAQSGAAKTAVGWLLVVLAIALGLLVVCRPNRRKSLDDKR